MTDCPIPEVAEALSPFIKPRAEVATIRRSLQAYIENQFQRNGRTFSVASLAAPDVSQRLIDPPPALSGVRRAYWKALQAHQIAQASYDALRAELLELREDNGANGHLSGDDASDAIIEGYIPLLRQREKHRKLQVIERALHDVDAAGSMISSGSVDDIVKSKAGEAPIPPTSSLAPSSHSALSEDKVLELKKAIISAKHTVDEQSASHPSSLPNETKAPPEAELRALRNAHDELTIWMEQQLAAIADAEAEDSAVPESPAINGFTQHRLVTSVEIEQLYDKYLATRQRLIQTIDHPPTPEGHLFVCPDTSNGPRNKDVEQPTSSAPILLPYIPHLISIKQQEQSLLQQSSYMKRHLSSAEIETERLVARLANESHLVHPGASRGKDWADAAIDAQSTTKEYVEQRVQAGMGSSAKAEMVLKKIHEVPKSLDNLGKAKI